MHMSVVNYLLEHVKFGGWIPAIPDGIVLHGLTSADGDCKMDFRVYESGTGWGLRFFRVGDGWITAVFVNFVS